MKKIELFDYQEDMKERIEKALCLHRSVMAQMPTGTGKTVLLASVVESFLREHSNCKVWIVAHRRELVSQIRETIERVFSKITPSLFTIKEGSTSHPDPLSSGAREETALLGARNRYALRLADHQRSSPAAELHFAVCDRMDTNRLRVACWVLAHSLPDAGLVLIPVCWVLAVCLILACWVLDT